MTSRRLILVTLLLCLSASAQAQKATGYKAAPTCTDLVWSAQVLKEDPDIATYCQGVYVKGDTLYAKLRIELTRVRNNRLTFRAVHPKTGHLGQTRSITVSNRWRVNIDGESVRASELQPGQQLSVYIPEDRFALGMDDGQLDDEESMIAIEGEDASNRQP